MGSLISFSNLKVTNNISDDTIENIQNDAFVFLKPIVDSLKVCKYAPHVSIAYIEKNYDLDVLKQLQDLGKEYKSSFFGMDYTIMSAAPDEDFLAISLTVPKNFENYVKKIDKTIEIKKYKGKLKPHISLLKGPKGCFDGYPLNILRLNFPLDLEIIPQSIQLWNEDHTLERQIKAKQLENSLLYLEETFYQLKPTRIFSLLT